jgi:nitrite reductase (NO-forming)/hydroxylamine reductase
VTLRDAGQVAIIDGDTYEIVSTVDSGYAVHITRMSATGRYAYVTGRDGRLALIDLWMEKPEVVARVQTCYDARSVEVSKYEGPEATSETSTPSPAVTGPRTLPSWTGRPSSR